MQNISLLSPPKGINCIIVANDQYNTPVTYNYKNNLKESPEKYSPLNNNNFTRWLYNI